MKQIADYLAEAEFSSELYESLQLGMLVVRRDWTVEAWSEVLENWTDTSSEKVVGKKLTDQYPHLLASHVAIQLDSVLQTGTPAILRPPLVPHLLPVAAIGEFANLPMMQEIRIHRISCEPHQALIVLRDVTAERLQREAFHREHDQLISVQQQLRDTNISLQGVTANAIEDAENKKEFLANMSHEIRCLMTPILGYADLLVDDPSSPNVSTAIETIRRNGEHLLGMLDDVLDLSRLDAGKVSLNVESTDPHQIANDVVSMMQARAEAKGLTIRTECAGPVPFAIQTDPIRVRQVLLNLISNSVQFTKAGSITVQIQLANNDPSCRQIAFNIVDTGSGLAPGQVDHLFRAFAHTHDNESGDNHGAGLGLTISRKLARMLGGNISVTSTGPQGTTFQFTVATGSLEGVPLLDHATNQSDTVDRSVGTSAGDSLPPTAAGDQRRPRVLIAEDAHDSHRQICAWLQDAGSEAMLVETGLAAVEEAVAEKEAGRPYDLILLDEKLPLMDGEQAMLRLREAGIRVPVVAMVSTAQAMEPLPLPAGFDDQLAKPLDRESLGAVLRKFTSAASSDPAFYQI